MMRYKTKFNLLRDEVVKANNELVDNKIFETYMDEEQDTIMGTNAIVKALVKTIKFYEQADHKLDTAITQKVCNARQELVTNDVFKSWLNFYLFIYSIDINEAAALALPKTIWELEEIARKYKKENDELRNANLKQFYTIQERNNEIDALKHMLDREEW